LVLPSLPPFFACTQQTFPLSLPVFSCPGAAGYHQCFFSVCHFCCRHEMPKDYLAVRPGALASPPSTRFFFTRIFHPLLLSSSKSVFFPFYKEPFLGLSLRSLFSVVGGGERRKNTSKCDCFTPLGFSSSSTPPCASRFLALVSLFFLARVKPKIYVACPLL